MRFPRTILFLFLLLTAVTLLPSCNISEPGPRGTAEGVDGHRPTPTPVLSLLGIHNGRVRCGFNETGATDFELLCRAVVVDDGGTEHQALGIEQGIKLKWGKPEKIQGAEVLSQSCTIAKDQLSQRCSIQITVLTGTRIRTSLIISDDKGQSKTEYDDVLLPFIVTSYGAVPQIPISFSPPKKLFHVSFSDKPAISPHGTIFKINKSIQEIQNLDKLLAPLETGFINQLLDPLKTELTTQMQGICVAKDRVFFSTSDSIYLLENNKLRLYAGSTNDHNKNDLSHRLRIRFGTWPDIACWENVLYVMDRGNSRLLKIQDSGKVFVLLDEKIFGDAITTGFFKQLLAIRSDGFLYATDYRQNRIVKLNVDTGEYHFIPTTPFKCDGKEYGQNTHLREIEAITLGSPGKIFALTQTQQCVIQIDEETGKVKVVLDQSISKLHSFNYYGHTRTLMFSIVADKENSVYVFVEDGLILRVRSDGTIEKFAGVQLSRSFDPGNPSNTTNRALLAALLELKDITAERLALNGVYSMAIDKSGNLFVPSPAVHQRIFKIGQDHSVSLLAGSKRILRSSLSDGIPAYDTSIRSAHYVTINSDGAVVFSDYYNRRVRQVSLSDDREETISTVAGSGEYESRYSRRPAEGVSATESYLDPYGIGYDSEGSLFIADRTNNSVRKVNIEGKISILAGSGKGEMFQGGIVPAKEAHISFPENIAIDSKGSVYVSTLHPHGSNHILRIFRSDSKDWLVESLYSINYAFHDINAVAIGPDDGVFIAVSKNYEILKYQNKSWQKLTLQWGNEFYIPSGQLY